MFLADRDGDYLGGRLKNERGERKGRRFEDAALDGALNRSEIVMRHRLIKTQDVIVNISVNVARTDRIKQCDL